jgi:hypothetical protein
LRRDRGKTKLRQPIDKNRSRRSGLQNVASRQWIALIVALVLVAGCEPSDRTPGFWLRGDIAQTYPEDWRFTEEYREIFVQVETPYFIAHSVTIFCVQIDGELVIGAREPETKNWVGWMENDRGIRLKIGEELYDVATAEISDATALSAVRAAYAEKYDMTIPAGGGPDFRFWFIVPRA